MKTVTNGSATVILRNHEYKRHQRQQQRVAVIIIIIIAIAYLERVAGMYVLARIYGHTTVAASGFGRGVYPGSGGRAAGTFRKFN